MPNASFSAWRPLFTPVEDSPLAFCDYFTVDKGRDLLAVDRISPQYVGEVYYLKHSADQRWYYLSGQRPDELALFVSYDSDPRERPACKQRNSKFTLTAN